MTDVLKCKEIMDIKFPVMLCDGDIEIIIKKVLDGGIMHWCDTIGSSGKALRESHKELTHGGILTFYGHVCNGVDVDGDELDKDGFLAGFKQYLKNPVGNDLLKFVDHKLVVDIGKVDLRTADAIIQYAIFGEIRYKSQSMETCLADLGFPVEKDDTCWEDQDTGFLHLYSSSTKTVYMIDPVDKRFCHKGIGEGCFYTEWEEI